MRGSRRVGAGLALWVAAAATTFGAASCLLAGIETTTSSNAGGGGTGATETGGEPSAGGSPTCADSESCPEQLCHSATCEDGGCIYTPTPGVLGVEQVDGDCRSNVCNEQGALGEVDDDDDVPRSPAPECQEWACEAGEVSQVAVGNCAGCCGASSLLSCEDGVCTGCVDPIDCGTPTDCFSYECRAGACVPQNAPNGATCGMAACNFDVTPAVDTLSSGACQAGACQPQTVSCGNYTCDSALDACNATCNQLNADDRCQPGNHCPLTSCVDCNTCIEIAMGAAATKSVCPDSVPIVGALEQCICDSTGNNSCAAQCEAMCTGGEKFMDCVGCITQKGLCTAERAACIADADPVP